LYAPESVQNKYFVNTQDGVTSTNGHPEGIEITGTDIGTARDYQIVVIAGTSNINVTMHPMIIPKDIFNAGFTDYQPYALSNTAITPALQECVNNGVKNLVNVPDITISASGGGYVTANNNVVLPAGKYVIIFNATATSGSLLTSFKDSGGNTIGSLELAMNGGQIKGTIFLLAQSSYFNAFANQPTTITKYMIITEAMYDAGFTDYQPYALSNVELTDNILIEEITSGITVASGYTKSSTTHVYKQGKHIFGTLVFEKSSGSYSTTGGDIVGTMGNYAPVAQWLGCGFFSDSVWTLKTCGYAFIQNAYGQGDAGQIIVTDGAGGTNKIVKIQIDYVMP